MNHSESFSHVAGALALAQGLFPTIPRDRSVTVVMKSGGKYNFSYAPLETILEKTRPGLAKNGLCLIQAIMLEDDGAGRAVEVLRTTLVHSSGEWFSNDVPIFIGAGDNKAQAYASGMTYSRRYGVTLILCVAADEDDDAGGGDQNADRPEYARQGPASNRGAAKPGQGKGRAAASSPADDQPAPQGELTPVAEAVDPATGEILSPWSPELTAGMLGMLKSRALAAGLSDEAVVKAYGVISPANVNAALVSLKDAVNAKVPG